MDKFVLAVVVLFLPAFSLGIRQYNEFNESSASADRLKEQGDKLWRRVMEGGESEEMLTESRKLQDEIYDHRRRSPVVFDSLYYYMRQSQEDQMVRGVKDLVAEYELESRK